VLLAPPVLPVTGVTLPPRTLVDLVTFPALGVPAARLAMAIMKRRPPAPEARYRRTVADPAVLRRLEAADLIRRSESLFAATSTRTLARALLSTARADMRLVAPGITAPTLVMTGDSDRVIHPHESSVLAGASLTPTSP
jgi:pimeloyl-ACP methyl ester carboxylesterase